MASVLDLYRIGFIFSGRGLLDRVRIRNTDPEQYFRIRIRIQAKVPDPCGSGSTKVTVHLHCTVYTYYSVLVRQHKKIEKYRYNILLNVKTSCHKQLRFKI